MRYFYDQIFSGNAKSNNPAIRLMAEKLSLGHLQALHDEHQIKRSSPEPVIIKDSLCPIQPISKN